MENLQLSWTRQDNDTNGNPRYAIHFLQLQDINPLVDAKINEVAEEKSKNNRPFKFSVEYKYDLTLKIAKEMGGKKYHNKKFGGGIIFQSYNIKAEESALIEFFNAYDTAKIK